MLVSWEDYSQYMESHKIHAPNHQPDTHIYWVQFHFDPSFPHGVVVIRPIKATHQQQASLGAVDGCDVWRSNTG